MKTKNENDVVIVNLDRPRELRFGYKAIKNMLASSSMSMEELTAGNFDFEQIEKFMFFGLQKDAKENGETLTIEMMEDILEHGEFTEIIEAFQRAITNAFGGHVEGNEQTQVAEKKAKKA